MMAAISVTLLFTHSTLLMPPLVKFLLEGMQHPTAAIDGSDLSKNLRCAFDIDSGANPQLHSLATYHATSVYRLCKGPPPSLKEIVCGKPSLKAITPRVGVFVVERNNICFGTRNLGCEIRFLHYKPPVVGIAVDDAFSGFRRVLPLCQA